MTLAFTFFGKEQNNALVSRDELFIMLCVFQSRTVNGATFMLANLHNIAQATHGLILIDGLVSIIATALTLRTPFSRLNPLGGYFLMDFIFCFNTRLIRNLGPNDFQLLVHHELVHHFTLPNIEKTSVHNKDNWIFYL